MDTLRTICSNGIILMTVGSAVITGILAIACTLATRRTEPSEPSAPNTQYPIPDTSPAPIDYTWMRAA